jgi:hypothetical protein
MLPISSACLSTSLVIWFSFIFCFADLFFLISSVYSDVIFSDFICLFWRHFFWFHLVILTSFFLISSGYSDVAAWTEAFQRSRVNQETVWWPMLSLLEQRHLHFETDSHGRCMSFFFFFFFTFLQLFSFLILLLYSVLKFSFFVRVSFS